MKRVEKGKIPIAMASIVWAKSVKGESSKVFFLHEMPNATSQN